MKRRMKYIAPLLLPVMILLAVACSTQKNTASGRWWHSFNAKYNTYYNGTLAYIDGALQKEQNNKDNFTEMIPLYTVGNKSSREIGKEAFDRAIEKCEKAIHQHSIKRRPIWDKKRRKTERDIEWLNRREYNPFLWKAWLLMGRSQFHSGAFDEAASTFAYMSRLYSTQPAIYGKARAWLAKTYVEQGWMYDAEDVIRNMKRDSLDWRAVKEWDYTYADYYIHTGEYEKAIPYLRKVIRHEMRRKQRAREWFLMGQLEAAMGHQDLANKAFRRVIRQNPPYELEFNARIALSEVMAGGQDRKMIRQLSRMAASDKNKDYLDQVYYAIGNIYLHQKDTLRAISAYEQGNRKATRNGIEKGVLLLHLGNLYWEKQRFSDASRCYNEAIGLLDTDRADYTQLSERAAVLDKLVPYTEAVELQDSLELLAKMNEKDRNAAIDRVINALKKKEKEERAVQDEQNARQAGMQNNGNIPLQPGSSNMAQQNQGKQQWYFYNPTAVSQGKTTFLRIWGKRENVDNWQRINKTVVASVSTDEEITEDVRDSIIRAEEIRDSIAQITDSAHNDPHRREYYLAQIPFTEEQLQTSNQILEDGLYHAGVIFKDQLDRLALSERNLRRLSDQYKDYEHMDDVYYHLFLLYSRMNKPAMANACVARLQSDYPKSQWTTILTDPYFKENAQFGTHIEDSLYASTYDAFKSGRYREVSSNTYISDTRFPKGANRDKFIFISGLSKLNDGDANGCVKNMETVINEFPESQLSEMAGMIINGVKAGRRLRGGKFDIGNVWERRTAVMSDSDSITARTFTPERNADFLFLFAYAPDSLNENQLLFELARFNFTNFLVRNFDMQIEDIDGIHRMQIEGFRNYDEALQYARQLYAQPGMSKFLAKGRGIIISQPNIELLGTQFSYDDYDKFYAKHFAPLKMSTFRLLTEPAEIETEENKEPTPEEIDRSLDDNTVIDNGFGIVPSDKGNTIIPNKPELQKTDDRQIRIPSVDIPNQKPANTKTTVIRNEPELQTGGIEGHSTIIRDTSAEKTSKASKSSVTIPMPEKKTEDVKKQPANSQHPVSFGKIKQPTQQKTTTTPTTVRSRTGIYFDDKKANKANAANQSNNGQKDKKKNEKEKKKVFDLEDEYYDLEGF